MSKAIPLLFFVLSLFCLCPSASALPQQHEVWHQGNDAYRTMYDRYEIGLQRAFDALSEETYKKLEKENDAAIDESVKQAGAAGENAALACAQALAERILIMEDLVSKADSERAAGSPNPLEGFYHLAGRQGDIKACQTKVHSDIEIETLKHTSKHSILHEGFSRPVLLKPALSCHAIKLEKAKPGENASDWQRLTTALTKVSATDMRYLEPDLTFVSQIYTLQKEKIYAVTLKNHLLDLKNAPVIPYGAAFDIGTTTVVGYLINLTTGKVCAVASTMNPQVQFGADVIMRANYALEHGTKELSSCIQTAINKLIGQLTKEAEIERNLIYQVIIAGNTCMHHLFLGISPASLVHAPYNPAVSQMLDLKASDFSLSIHPNGRLIMLPDIAGFVGADTIGCLLCVRPDLKEEITLTIDIGTNGEMVLGNREHLVTCSTAAGPAFEGAKIECGMRGAAGAVDHVHFENGDWKYTTIENEKPVGLCGSGLIDLTAELLKNHLIDSSGKFIQSKSSFTLIEPDESRNFNGVYLTQKDIREVQLAKAAIAAGIESLEQELGITEDQISKVYIAGAFGNYMNPQSACEIGMIPFHLKDKIVPVGNAAGEGAKIALINEEELLYADKLAKKISFVELAASEDFQDCFVDNLEFPDFS